MIKAVILIIVIFLISCCEHSNIEKDLPDDGSSLPRRDGCGDSKSCDDSNREPEDRIRTFPGVGADSDCPGPGCPAERPD